MSLHEILEHLGFTTHKSRYPGMKIIRNGTGDAVCEGRAGDVWEWLEKNKYLKDWDAQKEDLP